VLCGIPFCNCVCSLHALYSDTLKSGRLYDVACLCEPIPCNWWRTGPSVTCPATRQHWQLQLSCNLLTNEPGKFSTVNYQLHGGGLFLRSWQLLSLSRNINTSHPVLLFNRLTPNDPYMGRTAPLTSILCILYIYSTNIGTEYFKHALYSPFFFLQNAICFIMLTCLVPVLFTFCIQSVLKLKKIIPAPKG